MTQTMKKTKHLPRTRTSPNSTPVAQDSRTPANRRKSNGATHTSNGGQRSSGNGDGSHLQALIKVRRQSSKTGIGVGVIGCGYWGPNLLRNLNALPDCKVHWLCDLSPQRLTHMKSLYSQLRTTNDYQRLLEDKLVQAVVIATPVGTHHALAKASLLAGKHTFVEKPLARSSAECEELIELAAARGLTLMVGHTFLYSAPVRKIKEIIDRGDIGQLRYISARRLNLGLFQKDINVAWDLAPHDISIVLHLLGQAPESVNCGGNASVTPGVEDFTTMCLKFDRDRFAVIQSSWLDPLKVREMTIVGDRRMIVYNDVAPLEKIKIFDARVEVPPHYDTFAEFQPYLRHEEPLKIECQHFLDCIRDGREPTSSGRDGLEMVKILEAASLSIKRQGVAVPLNSTLRHEAELLTV